MGASDGKTIAIKFTATTSDLESGLKRGSSAVKSWASETQDSIAAVEQSTEKMARLWRSAFEAFIGFEVIKALKGVALGAADAESAIAVATTTAKNFGNALNAQAMEKWLEGFAKSAQSGGLALTDLRNSVQQFASIGQNQAQIERAIADAANLAAARHMSLAEATRVVSFALTGHVEMLTRYGIISREQAKNIKTTEQAMKALEKATKDAALGIQEPITAFARLGNATDTLRDQLGGYLAPILTALANAATNLVNAIATLPPGFLKMVTQVAAVTAATVALVLLLPAVWKGLELIGEGAKLILGLFTWLAPVVDLLGTAFEAVAAGELSMAAGFAAAALGPLLIAAGIGALIAIIAELLLHFNDTKRLFGDVWRYCIDETKSFANAFMGVFGPLIKIIEEAWMALAKYMAEQWKDFVTVFQGLTQDAQAIFEWFLGVLKPVMDGWDSFCDHLTNRFQGFVDKLEQQSKVAKDIIQGLTIAAAIANPLVMTTVIDSKMRGSKQDGKADADAAKVGADLHKSFNDAVTDAKNLASTIKNLFKSTVGPNVKVPTDAFKNTEGAKDKKKGDGAEKAAENALKNLEDLIKGKLDDINAIVDKAKSRVDSAKEKLADFDTVHPAGTPMSDADKAKREALVTEELKAQMALRASMLVQQVAENNAHSVLMAYAKAISKELKNHDQLTRQATDSARAHAKAARDIGLAILQAKTAYDQLVAAQNKKKLDELATSTTSANQQAQNTLAQQQAGAAGDEEAIQQAIAMLPYGGTGQGISWSSPPAAVGKHESAARETITEQTKTGSKSPSVEADKLAVALAELHLAVAQDTLDEKLTIQANDKARAATDHGTAAQQAFIDSTLAVTQAQNALAKANDDLTLANKKFFTDQQAMWNNLITGLLQKANAPGLSFNASTASISFNPMEMLFAALEQTQMFANVMTTVTQIVQTFSQALNALEPVVNALLDILRAIANVFIFLYNTVARILDLFGLQIQQLQYLTGAIGDLGLTIIHEIPTLNELAAGKLNSPLSTQPQPQTLSGSGQGQNELMKVVEVLIGILAAVMIAKVLETHSIALAAQQTMRLIGINMATVKSANQAPLLSAQQKQAVMTAQQQATQTANLIGSKAAASATLTNQWLQQIEMTLQQILTATQMNAAGGAGGFGAGIALIGAILGALGGGSGGGSSPGAIGGSSPGAQQATQALQQLSNAVEVVSMALTEHEREVRSSSDVVAKLTQNMTQLASAVQNADRSLTVNTKNEINGPVLNNGLDLDDLSEMLSRSTSRTVASANKGINRAIGS